MSDVRGSFSAGCPVCGLVDAPGSGHAHGVAARIVDARELQNAAEKEHARVVALEAENAKLRKTIAAVKQATRLTYSWSAEGMQAAMGGDWVYRHGELRAALAGEVP